MAAGPDFTPGDVRKAEAVFSEVASRLEAARPEAF
jgi:hypothetical protein